MPEGRRLFGAMSIEDNLLMGAYLAAGRRSEISRDLDRVYATFPKLLERRNQAAGDTVRRRTADVRDRARLDERAAPADDR